jgi:hypothetical protein
VKKLYFIVIAILFPLATETVVTAQVACPVGYPCIYDLFIATNNALVLRVNTDDFDVVQVRWSRPGREGDRGEFSGRKGLRDIVVLKSTTPGVTYTVSVNGCNRRALQRSVCSGWNSMSKPAN